MPNMQMCSETLVNPFPEGCSGIKRSFGLSFIGEHNYLTVKAFNKVRCPLLIRSPKSRSRMLTVIRYSRTVKGLRTFKGLSMSTSPSWGRRSALVRVVAALKSQMIHWEPVRVVLEYLHYPMGGDPVHFAIDGVRAQAGVIGNAIDYGLPSNQWLPSGTASGDGTLLKVRFVAKAYSVTINTFAGCEKYLDYVADGFCHWWQAHLQGHIAHTHCGRRNFWPRPPQPRDR